MNSELLEPGGASAGSTRRADAIAKLRKCPDEGLYPALLRTATNKAYQEAYEKGRSPTARLMVLREYQRLPQPHKTTPPWIEAALADITVARRTKKVDPVALILRSLRGGSDERQG